jgi:hypothetical protein
VTPSTGGSLSLAARAALIEVTRGWAVEHISLFGITVLDNFGKLAQPLSDLCEPEVVAAEVSKAKVTTSGPSGGSIAT